MTRKQIVLILSVFFYSATISAGQPLLTITPIFQAPTTIARDSFGAAIFQITNHTKNLTRFKLQPIPGISQVTTAPNACSDPILIGYEQTCSLNLHIEGQYLPSTLRSGPVICNDNASPVVCAQPSLQNSLNMTTTLSSEMAQNPWVSVLIAQDSPPTDTALYVKQIIALAPNAEQIHIRVDAGATNDSLYAGVVNLLRTAYGSQLAIGFHPDNSSSSYSAWGCSIGNWQCVLNASILAMNNINTLADPKKSGQGFNIFSLEQSYVEPVDTPTLKNIKACLNPLLAATGSTCPVVTIASPTVSFGDVLPSYGGCDPALPLSACQYGSEALDFGYPQYYNLGKNISSTYGSLLTNGYFPDYSAEHCIAGASYPYTVVDADTNGAYPAPKIPCTSTTPNVYTYADPTTGEVSPTLASAYVAYLMTQLPPISNAVNTNGATVYITFSGESNFLGAPGWSLAFISAFHSDLNTNFTSLQTQFSSLFPSGGTEPSSIKYGIWNFTSILGNE
jgi:hypothetical protein